MPDSTWEDTLKLVTSAQDGNERAVEDLFARYLPRTRQIVAFRMGWRIQQLEEHDDLVQEALLRVFQGLERFESRSEGSFRSWVASCVECAIQDRLRHADRKKRGSGNVKRLGDLHPDGLSDSIFAAQGETPSAVLQGKELEERIQECMLKLPDRFREVILLRAFCSMSYEEITTSLGFEREATARQAYSRAVRKLDQLLQEPDGSLDD